MPPYSAEEITSCLHFIHLDNHVEDEDHQQQQQQQQQLGPSESSSAAIASSCPTFLWWPCLRCDNLEMVLNICHQVGYLTDTITATITNNAKSCPVMMLLGQNVPNHSRFFFDENTNLTFQSSHNISIDFLLTCMAQCENNPALRSAFTDLRETFVVKTSRSNNKHYLADGENSNPTKRLKPLKPSIQDEKNAPTAVAAACAEQDVKEVADPSINNKKAQAATISAIGAAATMPPPPPAAAAATSKQQQQQQQQHHVTNATLNEQESKKPSPVEPKTAIATDFELSVLPKMPTGARTQQAADSSRQPAGKKKAFVRCDGCAEVELDSAGCFRFRLDCGGKCWICPGCFSECQAARQCKPTFACPNQTCQQRLCSSWIVLYPDANLHLPISTEPSVKMTTMTNEVSLSATSGKHNGQRLVEEVDQENEDQGEADGHTKVDQPTNDDVAKFDPPLEESSLQEVKAGREASQDAPESAAQEDIHSEEAKVPHRKDDGTRAMSAGIRAGNQEPTVLTRDGDLQLASAAMTCAGKQSNVSDKEAGRAWKGKENGAGVSQEKPLDDGLQLYPREKIVVRCSRGRDGEFDGELGNICYRRELSKYHSGFRKANKQRRQAIVDTFLAKFSFVLEGEEMTEKKVKEKVWSALYGPRSKKQDSKPAPKQNSQENAANAANTNNTAAKAVIDEETSASHTGAPQEKLTVYCGKRYQRCQCPGQDAYQKELRKYRPAYQKSDTSTEDKTAIVEHILASFTFLDLQTNQEVSEEVARHKIYKALIDNRLLQLQNSSTSKAGSVSKKRAYMPEKGTEARRKTMNEVKSQDAFPESPESAAKTSINTAPPSDSLEAVPLPTVSADSAETGSPAALLPPVTNLAQPIPSLVGKRVARVFGEGLFLGTITEFLPGGTFENVNFDMWHVEYDDGDRADYAIVNIKAMLALHEKAMDGHITI